MDDRSYDDTEPTPEPTPFRPPPPTHHPLPASPPREAVNASLLDQTLFSFSIDGTLDEIEESLPSLRLDHPPSPISRPSESLFGDDNSSRQQHPRAPSTISRASSRQPPIYEVDVRLDNNDDDTFFECFESRSLAQRTRRSLLLNTPEAKSKPSTSSPPQLQQQPQGSVSTSEEQNPSSDDVARVHDNALQALMRLKEELMKANEKNHAAERETQNLIQERDGFKQQLEEQGNKAQAKVQELRYASFRQEETTATLKSQNEELTREKGTWTEEKKDLEAKVRAAAREKKEYMHRKLAAENRQKELKSQLDTVKAELEEALAAKEELASDLGSVQNEKLALEKDNVELTQQIKAKTNSDTMIGKLRSEIELKDQEINRTKTALDEFKETSQKEKQNLDEELKAVSQKLKDDNELSQKEIERVKTALREVNEAMHNLRSGSSPKARPLLRSPSSPSRRTSTNFASTSSSVRFQTEPLDPSSAGVTLDNSIVDRLARMRDSAERANLIRSHKREASRLKLDKEAEIKKMVTTHEEAMRKALKQADLKTNSRLDELKKTLTEEYEERLDEVESRHNQKFAEMEQEHMRRQEADDESIRAALSKVTSTTQQCEREVARREALERSVDQLNHRTEQDKKELLARHGEEREKRRMEWEMERDTLLTVIQTDCNSAFERRRSNISRPSPSRPSPTTVDSDFFSKMTVDTSRPEPSPSRIVPAWTPSLISPAYSDIDSVLRETEDLIQSIM